MNKGKEKYIFPGGHTPVGFYSFYDQIMTGDSGWSIYIIKGGPGTGKSGIIKRLPKQPHTGYNVELLKCSGDVHSLDGVIIPSLKVAIIDGTSPHIVDAALPGSGIILFPSGIIGIWKEYKRIKADTNAQKEISELYRRVYNYLAAAKIIRNNMDMVAEKLFIQAN